MKLSIYGGTLHLTPETPTDKLILHTLVESTVQGHGRNPNTGDVDHVQLNRNLASEMHWFDWKFKGKPFDEAQKEAAEMGLKLHRYGTITTCDYNVRRLNVEVDEQGNVSEIKSFG